MSAPDSQIPVLICQFVSLLREVVVADFSAPPQREPSHLRATGEAALGVSNRPRITPKETAGGTLQHALQERDVMTSPASVGTDNEASHLQTDQRCIKSTLMFRTRLIQTKASKIVHHILLPFNLFPPQQSISPLLLPTSLLRRWLRFSECSRIRRRHHFRSNPDSTLQIPSTCSGTSYLCPSTWPTKSPSSSSVERQTQPTEPLTPTALGRQSAKRANSSPGVMNSVAGTDFRSLWTFTLTA
jgi:hypothetical protein